MSWKLNPQQLQEAELLRQWRRSQMEVRLQVLPLEFLLRSQCRYLEAIEEDALARTGCLPVHRKLMRLTKKMIRSASAWLVKRPLLWLSQRRSLLWLRPALVQGRRRLVCLLLLLLVRALRRSRSFPGIRRR